jgi:hypothetical protein
MAESSSVFDFAARLRSERHEGAFHGENGEAFSSQHQEAREMLFAGSNLGRPEPAY